MFDAHLFDDATDDATEEMLSGRSTFDVAAELRRHTVRVPKTFSDVSPDATDDVCAMCGDGSCKSYDAVGGLEIALCDFCVIGPRRRK